MIPIGPPLELSDIRERADRIRSAWTQAERSRRTGLPPDIPGALRSLLGERGGWSARPVPVPLRTVRNHFPLCILDRLQ
jgi:hypothetical protein